MGIASGYANELYLLTYNHKFGLVLSSSDPPGHPERTIPLGWKLFVACETRVRGEPALADMYRQSSHDYDYSTVRVVAYGIIPSDAHNKSQEYCSASIDLAVPAQELAANVH